MRSPEAAGNRRYPCHGELGQTGYSKRLDDQIAEVRTGTRFWREGTSKPGHVAHSSATTPVPSKCKLVSRLCRSELIFGKSCQRNALRGVTSGHYLDHVRVAHIGVSYENTVLYCGRSRSGHVGVFAGSPRAGRR